MPQGVKHQEDSTNFILSEKSPNKTGYNKPMADEVEKRRLAERNTSMRNKNQAQSRVVLSNHFRSAVK